MEGIKRSREKIGDCKGIKKPTWNFLMMQLKMQLIFTTINVPSYICVLLDKEQIASYRPDCGILS